MSKIKNIVEYAPKAVRTLKSMDSFEMDMFHFNTGISTEVNEIINMIKGSVVYGKPFDVVNVKEELGDLMWFSINKILAVYKEDAIKYLELIVEEEDKLEEWVEAIIRGRYDFTKTAKENFEVLNKVCTILISVPWEELIDGCQFDTAKKAIDIEGFVENFYLYVAVKITAKVFSISFEDILTSNIAKLQARYPDKFTEEAAVNRDLDAERKILEN